MKGLMNEAGLNEALMMDSVQVAFHGRAAWGRPPYLSQCLRQKETTYHHVTDTRSRHAFWRWINGIKNGFIINEWINGEAGKWSSPHLTQSLQLHFLACFSAPSVSLFFSNFFWVLLIWLIFILRWCVIWQQSEALHIPISEPDQQPPFYDLKDSTVSSLSPRHCMEGTPPRIHPMITLSS